MDNINIIQFSSNDKTVIRLAILKVMDMRSSVEAMQEIFSAMKLDTGTCPLLTGMAVYRRHLLDENDIFAVSYADVEQSDKSVSKNQPELTDALVDFVKEMLADKTSRMLANKQFRNSVRGLIVSDTLEDSHNTINTDEPKA